MDKTGILLMNIGTPSGSDTEAVRKYLSEFLMDRDVVNAPWLVREILFNRIIVPRRAMRSAQKYQLVWTQAGSPLMVFSQKFADKLQVELGNDYVVKIGMRYGEPSIAKALREFASENIQNLLLAPLYPQLAQATTGSSLTRAEKILHKIKYKPSIRILKEFYSRPEFIQSWIDILSSYKNRTDHWLFSFHGLPVSQIKKTPGCYSSENCCELAIQEGRSCYRAQCLQTARSLALGLGLGEKEWSVSFQSRLGPVKWIEPFTDATLEALAKSGVKNLAVCAPSFVADGLETLEELNIEGQETFRKHGGQNFNYIPCLNDTDPWVKGFASIVAST